MHRNAIYVGLGGGRYSCTLNSLLKYFTVTVLRNDYKDILCIALVHISSGEVSVSVTFPHGGQKPGILYNPQDASCEDGKFRYLCVNCAVS